MAALTEERQRLRQERMRLATEIQAVRNEWRSRQEQAHARELEVNDLRHRRDTLVARLREDYQIELAAFAAESATVAVVPAQADEEIAELRRKLAKLGSVNLEALEELRELETRATTLQTQFDDLAAAKHSLEEIISKINQDSRRLFMETFATVQTHFQELFRKLFGGGMADIVLEDENDLLESGIEIIARPPGKELRSISLMSGGEKTLTAVALLLAIFRSKPSPFCLLDEVDAALDEANIGRFTAVLARFPGPVPVHHHHPFQKDDGLRGRALRHHHAGIRHLQTGGGAVRGLAGGGWQPGGNPQEWAGQWDSGDDRDAGRLMARCPDDPESDDPRVSHLPTPTPIGHHSQNM